MEATLMHHASTMEWIRHRNAAVSWHCKSKWHHRKAIHPQRAAKVRSSQKMRIGAHSKIATTLIICIFAKDQSPNLFVIIIIFMEI